MAPPTEKRSLHIEIDTQHCRLSGDELERMDADLEPLRAVCRDFPVVDLYITIIRHGRGGDFHVKTSLLLPGRTLFTGEREDHAVPAFSRCARKLVHKVDAYKAELERSAEHAKVGKGTAHEVLPTRPPDADKIDAAVEARDYAAFRTATFAYDEPLRRRIGRWVQRYPRIEAKIGHDLQIDDLIEEVFLNAFERYGDRPNVLTLGEWLENLIDPSIKQMIRNPDEEMLNISFARSTHPE